MKGFAWLTLLAVIAVLLLTPSVASGFTVTIAWKPSPSQDVNSYKIYWGTGPRTYTGSEETGDVTEYMLTQTFTDGVWYYFTVTALDVEGYESNYCNEVSTDGVGTDAEEPAPPGGCYIKAIGP